MKVFVILLIPILSEAGGAQLSLNPSPSASGTPVPIKSRAAKGVEFKNLSSPGAEKHLKWQKVIVGQEPIDGAALVGLPKSSVWKRLGFQSGDVIFKVNEKEVHSSQDLDSALSDIERAQDSSLDVRILRGNHQLILNYQLHW